MKFDSLNRWLTLIANVGVVVGIFALIAELNHSSRLAEVSAFQSRMTEIQEAQLELALSNDLAAILEKYQSQGVEALSPVELRRVRAWNNAVIRRMQAQYFQYLQGFLDRSQVEEGLSIIANGRYDQWKELGLLGVIQVPEWRAEIEARIAAGPSL